MPDSKKTKYSEVPQAPGGTEGPKEESVGLKPKLTLMNGITVIVGSIIGSGIFVSPSGVLLNTGSPNLALVVWTVSGIFSMIGAYCYAELGCMIAKTGADYAYIMVTFGPFLAFIRLWVECMIVRPCSQAIVALTFSTYILKPFFPDCDSPDEAIRLLAAVVICFLTFVNCWNVKWASFIQDFFTYAKLLALVIIIITGFVQIGYGHTEHFTFDNSVHEVDRLALSFYSGLFAYNGWNYLNFIVEELKDPVKNLPRAIGVSIILVMAVYILTNVAFFTTLSPAEILASPAVAVTFANRLYGYMAWIIPVFVAMSTFGAVNGILLTSSRLFYAGAMEGQMPEVLTMIQTEKNTPAPAVLFVALLSLLYLTSSNIVVLINYVGFATWLSIGVAVVCIPVLRYKQPDWPRPIKVNMFFPIIYILATIFITVVPMWADPVTTGFGCLVILSAIPVYFLFIAWRNKPAPIKRLIKAMTRVMQFILIVVPPKNKKTYRNILREEKMIYIPQIQVTDPDDSVDVQSVPASVLAARSKLLRRLRNSSSSGSLSPLSSPDETSQLLKAGKLVVKALTPSSALAKIVKAASPFAQKSSPIPPGSVTRLMQKVLIVLSPDQPTKV